MIGTYFDKKGKGRHMTAQLRNKTVKDVVKALQLNKNGFPEKSVGSHGLRAEGARAMHLNRADNNTIKLQGRRTSDTFLMYIHQKISEFSAGFSKKMSTVIEFRNIANQFEPTPGTILVCG